MRIAGGIHRSRKLEAPKNDAVRPTSDKVRLAIFNMLTSRGVLADAIVIDAFCGTGALGLEALSQGAEFCTFFDKNKESIALCRTNVKALKEETRSKIILLDVTKLKEKPEEINLATLVFLDPPYRQNLVFKTIESLQHNHWLDAESFFVIETAKDETIEVPNFDIDSEKIYGDTKITLGLLKI